MSDRGLRLDDEALLAQCEMTALRRSGPGGQHRNRRDSGVRLRHRPTGVRAEAFERRSQHQNRTVAIRRLRRRIALTVREPVDPESFSLPPGAAEVLPGRQRRLGPRQARFWEVAASVLDLFLACDGRLAGTAARLGISTAALARFFASDPHLLAEVNRLREEAGLRRLRG